MLALLLVAGLGLEAEVGKLADPAPHVRARARRVLLKAGARAVPALRAGLAAKDVEARRGAALILDVLVRRSLRDGRKNPAYKIPKNDQVEQLRGLGILPNVRDRILGNRAAARQFAGVFRGVLYSWKDPSLTDYNGLLVSFAEYVARTTTRADNGIDVLENLLAADAILWKLEELGTELPGGDWTTLWIVRRNVLTEIHATMARRGKKLSAAETHCYRRALLFLKPLCDECAGSTRTKLVARLSNMGDK